jgi:hypothetical protein
MGNTMKHMKKNMKKPLASDHNKQLITLSVIPFKQVST